MKILKKHGKKVSVILLAIALMITPMLPIVKAAETCEKRFHYYLLLAEEAWIDNVSIDKNTVKRQYSTEYPQYFGFTDAETKADSIFATDPGYGLNPGYVKGDVTVATGELTAKAATKDMPTGYDATFFNYQIDDAYTLKSDKPEITYWDEEDWARYANMYENLQKVTSTASNADKAAKSYLTNDEDVYFIHYNWRAQTPSSEEVNVWKDSDQTHALKTLFAEFSTWQDSMADTAKKGILTKLKNSSINVVGKPKTGIINNSVNKIGKDSDSIITISALRDFDDISRPTNLYYWNVTAADKSTDWYYWFYFPMEATYTFTASGDVCGTGGGVIDTSEDSTSNPGTGIVSYAIIGTLLVGAVSAYIYARKNNKFNKV